MQKALDLNSAKAAVLGDMSRLSSHFARGERSLLRRLQLQVTAAVSNSCLDGVRSKKGRSKPSSSPLDKYCGVGGRSIPRVSRGLE